MDNENTFRLVFRQGDRYLPLLSGKIDARHLLGLCEAVMALSKYVPVEIVVNDYFVSGWEITSDTIHLQGIKAVEA